MNDTIFMKVDMVKLQKMYEKLQAENVSLRNNLLHWQGNAEYFSEQVKELKARWEKLKRKYENHRDNERNFWPMREIAKIVLANMQELESGGLTDESADARKGERVVKGLKSEMICKNCGEKIGLLEGKWFHMTEYKEFEEYGLLFTTNNCAIYAEPKSELCPDCQIPMKKEIVHEIPDKNANKTPEEINYENGNCFKCPDWNAFDDCCIREVPRCPHVDFGGKVRDEPLLSQNREGRNVAGSEPRMSKSKSGKSEVKK
jgi:RNA polymerase-binding transcription factor DksA